MTDKDKYAAERRRDVEHAKRLLNSSIVRSNRAFARLQRAWTPCERTRLKVHLMLIRARVKKRRFVFNELLRLYELLIAMAPVSTGSQNVGLARTIQRPSGQQPHSQRQRPKDSPTDRKPGDRPRPASG